MVLEARISAWAEHKKCRAKGQAGFRKDFRTSDQVFIIQTLVQQAKQAKRKLYCCFVDFKKAFDLVPRQTLWSILEKRGMKGKVLQSLQTMYAADVACVLTSDGPTDPFACGIGVKQGCPASPLLFGLYLDELEKLLEDARDTIDCPSLADIILAILLFADDIALFSLSPSGLQEQLDILAAFCAKRGLTVNVQKTKILVFESKRSQIPDLRFNGELVERVDEFKYLGIMMHGTRGLGPAVGFLCKAAKRAMFALQRRCQQLRISDPILKCKLFDTLVKPILSYCCEIWSALASKQHREDMLRIERGFLKALLGVQVRTPTSHVYGEFGRYPLDISWQSQAAKYLDRLNSMSDDRVLKKAFIADCRLPSNLSWHANIVKQLEESLIPDPTPEDPHHRSFSMMSAQSAYQAKLQSPDSSDPHSKAMIYNSIKDAYGVEPYIQRCNNRHLRRILAQFRTGSHWLRVETGRHSNLERCNRTCPMCSHRVKNPGLPAAYFDSFDSDEEGSDPVEDEHHMIFECSGYVCVRAQFQDLFSPEIVTIGQFLNQPDCNRVAKFLTWAKMIHTNFA